MKITILSRDDVLGFNQKICTANNMEYRCYDAGKIESALHSTFYPGSDPFQHGGVAKVAGAMAFYILKAHAFFDGNKRTALIASTIFMNLNGFDLRYALPEEGWSDLAKALDQTAANEMDMENLKDWYDQHKTPLT